MILSHPDLTPVLFSFCIHSLTLLHAEISALSMHVPMFPRAMHCLKVESVSPPWGGGGGGGCHIKYSFSSLSSVLAQPPSVNSPSHPAFCHSFSFSLLYIDMIYTLLYVWISRPTRSAHPDTSSLHQFAGALERMQHCLSLFTVDFTNDSQQQLFSPSTQSFSVLFCERAHVWNLASRLPSLAPFQTPRDAFCRLLWTI